jgi:excisionase family DNA binding protein
MEQNITFDTKEAAAYLKIHYETLLKMARKRQVPHHRIGRKLLFRKDSLDAWIQEQEQKSVMTVEEQDKVTFLRRTTG